MVREESHLLNLMEEKNNPLYLTGSSGNLKGMGPDPQVETRVRSIRERVNDAGKACNTNWGWGN